MCRRLVLLFSFALVLGLASNGSAFTWISQDVGGPSIPGSADYNSVTDIWTVTGSGGDIWGNADQFQYAVRPLSGNGSVTVKLEGMNPVTDGWAKVGVMIRASLTGPSTHASMLMSGANGIQFAWRPITAGGCSSLDLPGPGPADGYWLRIERVGNLLIGSWSADGIDFYSMDGSGNPMEVAILMGTNVYIGIVSCSHNNGALCTATFSNVTWDVLEFNPPWAMSPPDGATGLPLSGVTLSWMPGENATGHDIYFGTDAGALPLVAQQALGDEDYDTGPLDGGTMYYWQIVETNNPEWPGPVWSFKTMRPGTGAIKREIFEGIGGTAVTDLTGNPAYPLSPTWSDLVTPCESPDLGIDNYGGRLVGYLRPETSGDYTFWIAADDGCELWLSTTESPCDAVKISFWTGWTGWRDYDAHPEQTSAAIPLIGGEKYYISALWKEGGGGDHVSVAWQGPDSPSRSPIDGYYLATGYVDYWASAPNPAVGATILPLDATLSWHSGATAAQHEVYFGTDPGAMSLIATNAVGDEDVDVTALVSVGNTYYWKVNEVNGLDVVEGCLWSFSVEEWACMDIGTSGGSTDYNEATGTWTINADGADIWGTSDQFRYCYQKMKMTRSTGEIQARMVAWTIPGDNGWRKAGVMIRESLAANSKWIMQAMTGGEGGGETLQWRDGTGWDCGNWNSHSGVAPAEWIKLVRNGDAFTGYHAEDYGGVPGPWQLETGIHYHSTPETVYIGLAVTSHVDGFVAQAVLDNVSIWTPDPDQAWGPSPSDGATGVPIEGMAMTWNPGDAAAEHKVYMGTDPDAMALVATKSLGDESYDPGMLDLATTYYWSITEVNDAYEVEGQIWAFTTQNYLVIDDFESYDDPPVLAEDLPEQEIVGGGYIAVAAEAPPEQTGHPGYTIEAVPPPGQGPVAPQVLDDGAVIVTDPDRGQVLSLDGAGDWVDCGNPAALNFGTNDWSLCAWFKTAQTGTGDQNKGNIISNGGDGSGGHRYALGVGEQTEGLMTLTTDDDASKKQAKSTSVINDDIWHHVVGMRQGDTIKLYIDGVPEASTGLPAGYDLSGTSQHEVLIGAIYNHNGGAPYIYKDYGGLIDEVRIYDVALTDDEVLYLAEKGGTDPGTGNLVGYWAFEGDFTDSSGNGYDGTPVGYMEKPAHYGPLLVHYTFDEGTGDIAGDSSGNGLDGAIVGAAWDGGALDFNGLGDYVVNNDVGTYINGYDALSVSVWIQSDLVGTDKGFIIFEDPGGQDRRGFRYDAAGASGGGTNVIKYGVSTAATSEEDESPADMQTTDWQHLLMTWESGVGLKLYVNGVPTAPSYKDDIESGTLSGYTKLLVGKGGKDGAADASWDGRIDDVRVYSIALTEGNARYLAGLGDLVVSPDYGPMVAQYLFEGDLTDATGNERTATAYGAVGFETDPTMGQVLDMPGGDDQYVACPPMGISGANPSSITCWAKADNTSIPDWTLIFGFSTPGGGDNTHFNIGSLGGPGGVGAHVWGWEATIFSDTDALEWRHYAMTYDGTTVRYYGDGLEAGQADRDLSPRGDYVNIGKRNTQASSFPGNVEDARVYNMALSYGNVRYVAGVGDLYIPEVYAPMIVEYKFDTDASDTSGNGLDGSLAGDAKVEDGVLKLDGDGDYLDVGLTPLTNITGQVTVAAWIKLNAVGGDMKVVGNQDGSTGGYKLGVYSDGRIEFEIRTSAGSAILNRDVAGGTPLTAGVWYHVAGVYSEGNYIRTYVNGILDRELLTGEVLGGSSGSLKIGREPFSEGSYLNGQVDDFRLYDCALTYGQMLTLAGYTIDNPLEGTWKEMLDADISLGFGSKWMDMAYDNSQWMYQAQARRNAPFADWTKGQAKALTLWFRGNAGNAGELAAMYVTLRDHPLTPDGRHSATVAYDGDRSDLNVNEWQEWNIALSEFGDVNLPGMGDIALGVIGLGDAGNPGGLLGFDDIRLYPTRCVPKYGPLADLTDDCVVDGRDLRILLNDWLGPEVGPGLRYEYYEAYYNLLPDFDKLTPVKTGRVNNFDIGVRDRDDGFAFRFRGEVEAPAEADYTFYTSSDDGSKLYIGDVEVVNNDGLHGEQWMQGTIHLTAGKHPITVTMFENGGGEALHVEVESAGAGIPRMPVPDEVLSISPAVLMLSPSIADLNEDVSVNLADYAVMMEEWLTEKWWP